MKQFNGKAIYNPSGKANEYSYWACNFYVGCYNGCTYCYCKKGILAGVMGQDKPQLKKCFKNEAHAFHVFCEEALNNRDQLRQYGIFFSFTTDPMLPETIDLTWNASGFAVYNGIPVKILTKCTEWVADWLSVPTNFENWTDKDLYAFGFTLTGCDDLEPGASTNAERIAAMKKLHDAGFKTFASIEPVIDFESSKKMIWETRQFCDLYKIGLESGKKYIYKDLMFFMDWIYGEINNPIYFKDSLLKAAGISRESLPANCVARDYNMFNTIPQP